MIKMIALFIYFFAFISVEYQNDIWYDSINMKSQVEEENFDGVDDLISKYKDTGDTVFLNKALLIALSDGNKTGEGEVFRQLGLYYGNGISNNQSIRYLLKSLDAFILSADTSGLMKVNLNLGVIHYDIAELTLALEYLEKAAFYAKQLNNPMALSIILGNLGSIYERQDDGFAKALACHQEALALSKMLKDTTGLLSSFNNLGVLHEKNNNFEEAFAYYHQALQFALYTDNSTEACRIQTNLASLHISQGNFENALKLIKNSEDICQNADMMLDAHRLSLLSEAFAALENFRQAYYNQNKYLALSDSIFNIERLAAINELSKKYETEKKEQQIQLLEKDIIIQKEIAKRELDKRRAMLTATLLVAFFSVFLVIVYLEKRKINKRLAVLNVQLKKSETQLKELNQSKDKFFGILSHDLRNPLAAFEKLSSSLIGQPPDKQKKTAMEMAENSKLLSSLLNNLLIWSKAEQGLLSMKPQALLLHQIADASLALFKTQANENNIELINHTNPDLMVFADRESLHTIFRNIIGNAIKFTRQGSVTITSEEVNELAHITVSDTGIGMNKQQVDRLFALSSSHHAGLGLILCKELAQRNNADITLSSQPDIGTKVLISIPIFRTHEDSLN